MHFLKAVSWILDNLARGSQSKQDATSVGWTVGVDGNQKSGVSQMGQEMLLVVFC